MNIHHIFVLNRSLKNNRSLVMLTIILILSILCVNPVTATSEPPAGPPEIANFQSSYANGILSYSGEVTDSVMAVAIILSDSDGTVIKADSIGINPDMTFAGEMEVILMKADTYSVSAANYEGGTTTSTEFFFGTFNITYELDGGVNNPGNPATYNIEDKIVLLYPTRDSYAFDGWYLDSELTERSTGWDAGTTGDKTVYAKWSAAVVKIPKTGEASNDHAHQTVSILLMFAVSALMLIKILLRASETETIDS